MDYEKLRNELIADEGIRLKPYICPAGFLTTGVGHNLDANPLTPDQRAIIGHDGRKAPITIQQAMVILDNDIDLTVSAITKALPWFSALDGVRQRVLVNMAFNLGVDGLLKFKNTLKLIQYGHYAEASLAMLQSLWARQVGARAKRLSKLMEKGA